MNWFRLALRELRRRPLRTAVTAAGVAIVYTSHYIEEVQALCSRVGIIDHGKLIACDALAALLQLDVERAEGLS